MKKLLRTKKSDGRHWVGDGFPVQTVFSYTDIAKEVSPFLLLDYAGPAEFTPTEEKRGVGEHPHRGFETVTIVYSGEVAHRDSSGAGGVIGPGDVQWMTAASGVIHEEYHGPNFAKNGGRFEMVQLWVNLPRKDKLVPPRYQAITDAQIPTVTTDGGQIRIIAGEYAGKNGPAKTFSPINLWDIRLKASHEMTLEVPAGHTTALFVLSGSIKLGSSEMVGDSELAVLDTQEKTFSFKASTDAKVLLLGGEPLNEPIVGYGPFVMTSQEEIQQAFDDYRNGRMGRLG